MKRMYDSRLHTETKWGIMEEDKKRKEPGEGGFAQKPEVTYLRELLEQIQMDGYRPPAGQLHISETEVLIEAECGEKADGFFQIFSEEDNPVEGYVLTSEERMQCTPRFCGTKEQIEYRFDAGGLVQAEQRRGSFYLLTTLGEYEIPYLVKIKERKGKTGEIQDLFSFVNLARTDWTRAVRIFYEPSFENLVRDDERLLSLYRGLSCFKDNEHNLEQFLVAAGKKQPVNFTCDRKELTIQEARGYDLEEISIQRDGWGYTRIEIQTKGDFLSIEKQYLNDDNFLGNQCRIPLLIKEENLHAGKNFGEITFLWENGKLEIPVTVITRRPERTAVGRYREEKHYQIQLLQLYLSFRMRKINADTWKKEAQEIVAKWRRITENDLTLRLFLAQLYMTEEKKEEAQWMLSKVQDEIHEQDGAVYCYYLYLTTFVRDDISYVDSVTGKVESIFERSSDDWRIAWLLLFLSRELNWKKEKRWQFLTGLFQRGCSSPLLYLEAAQMFNANPTLIMRIDQTAYRIVSFGLKHRFLNANAAGHFVYLAGKQKYYDEVLFRLLAQCYVQFPEKETLQVICELLIKGNRSGSRYYSWYLKGVEEELKVTRLYEYYLMSLDLNWEVPLPKTVLLYFAYQSNLDYHHSAYLYAYVQKHKKKDRELYDTYRDQMERFVIQQLYKGNLDVNLSSLYMQLPESGLLNKESAGALAPLLFVKRLKVDREEITHVAVRQRGMAGEEVYPVHQGFADICIYGKEAEIFLQDVRGNRTLVTEECDMQKFLDVKKLVPVLKGLVEESPLFDRYLCKIGEKNEKVTEQNVDRFRRLAEDPALDETYARKIRRHLLDFYSEKERFEEMDRLLERSRRDDFDTGDLPEAVKMLVFRGFYEKAYQFLEGIDSSQLGETVLLRLCSRLLEQELHVQEKRMTALVYQAFERGKYESHMLHHLVCCFEGPTDSLRKIMEAAENFAVDTYPVCEHLIEHLLYMGADVTGEEQLLRQYVAQGGKSRLEGAFLHRCCYAYILEKKPLKPYMALALERFLRRGEDCSDMSRLALMQYYVEHPDKRNSKIDELLVRTGKQLLEKGFFLPVLQEYADIIPGAEMLLDKTFVVFFGKKEQPVCINYRIMERNGGNAAYRNREMQHIYEGIYAVPFILFTGETLQYYITLRDGDKQILDSGILKREAGSPFIKNSRYGMLNEISSRRLLREADEAAELLYQYMYTDWMSAGLFKPLS